MKIMGNLNKQAGFTIVELLIVIVVIGILAAIVIVAYNGVQDRANDAAVKSDLSNFMKHYQMAKVDDSSGSYIDTAAEFQAIDIPLNRSAYATTPNVNYNITGCQQGGGAGFAVTAVSKSGNRFYASSESGSVQQYTGAADWSSTNANPMCDSALSGSSYIGSGGHMYYQAWRAWAG